MIAEIRRRSSDQNLSSTMEGRRALDDRDKGLDVVGVDRLGPHGGHAATETDHRKWRQPTSEVEEFRDIQRQWA